MNFQYALTQMKLHGRAVKRDAWDDPKMVATLEGTRFYKVIPCQVANYTHAKLGWNPTTNDLLAEDWRLAK